MRLGKVRVVSVMTYLPLRLQLHFLTCLPICLFALLLSISYSDYEISSSQFGLYTIGI